MTDETDTTSEVARVLGEHRADRIGDNYLVCRRCGGLASGITATAHMAAMLAEAGLLRDPAELGAKIKLTQEQAREVERLTKELEKTSRAAQTLGRIIEQQCRDVLDATGMHPVIDEDGDGDWELVWERLAEMGRARKAAETKGDPR
jgi:hypothetical protein